MRRRAAFFARRYRRNNVFRQRYYHGVTFSGLNSSEPNVCRLYNQTLPAFIARARARLLNISPPTPRPLLIRLRNHNLILIISLGRLRSFRAQGLNDVLHSCCCPADASPISRFHLLRIHVDGRKRKKKPKPRQTILYYTDL